jgi:hypothetical protein
MATAMAMAMALFGPWPDLSVHTAWVGLSLPSSCLGRWDLQRGYIVAIIIVHNFRSGGCLRYQGPNMGIAVHSNQICISLLRLGHGEGQVFALLLPAALSFERKPRWHSKATLQ